MASQDTTTFPGNGSTTTGNETDQNIKGKVSNMASQAKNTAADWGRSAASTVDRNLQSAAGALEGAATAIRDRVPQSGGKLTDVAATTAEKIESTARYLREHDTADMVAGMESLVRRNPGASLCAALAVGFLIGTAIRKDRY